MNDSDADARHAIRGHAVLERLTRVSVVLLHHRRGEASANTVDSTLDFGRGHSLSREVSWLKE
jgi:hypothetical protein